ncbi:MAG: T9SS type A sorting domain-containing protein [Ignavibacteriales bacterium]|nr:T9SS type A sorting domain-containing protein [Ignavibacteriales bacterium]
MKQLYFFTFAYIFALSFAYAQAQAPSWQWAKSAGGTGNDNFQHNVLDDSGNSYVVGSFRSQSVTFDTTTVLSQNHGDTPTMCFVKYDSSGNVLWVRSAVALACEGNDIAEDNYGNYYVGGNFYVSTITLDTITRTTGNNYWDVFVAKYNADGKIIWVRTAQAYGRNQGCWVSADKSGGVYSTGIFESSTITFGTTTLLNSGAYDMYLVRYDANGNVKWAKKGGGGGYEQPIAMAVDTNGNCYYTGYFQSPTISFGTTTLTNKGGMHDMFIVKYDSNGNVLWAKNPGGTGSDIGSGIGLDSNGNCLVSGSFSSPTITFGTTTLTNNNAGSSDFFVVKYNGNGDVIWAKSAGGTFDESCNGMTIDHNNNIYILGTFNGSTLTLDSTTLTNNGGYDFFIIKYDQDGNVVWAKSAGGTGNEEAYDIAINDSSCYVSGLFMSPTLTLGTTTLVNNGDNDMFIAKLNNTANLASISGLVFHDIDGNGIFDGADSTLTGWNILLKNSIGATIDSKITDSGGHYNFSVINPGIYTISEVQDTNWILTYPTGLGTYTVTVSGSVSLTDKDFGNTYAYRYTGDSTGNWSDSLSWTGGIPPSSDKFVSIPTGVVVTIDSLPQDSVRAIRIESGGTLQFSPTVSKLNVLRTLQIDDGANLQFPETSDTTGIKCFKDWVNRGTLDPGHSIITFAGDQPKVIASDGGVNTFYKIEITGDSTSVIGNFTVKNQMILPKGISTREQDTILVENNDTSAISDTGIVTQGTIKRNIKLGETGTYRFESPGSYIKFSGEGTNPCAVSMTVLSNQMTGNFYWDSLGGRIDTLKNTIVIDSAKKFSKWPFGIPRPKIINSLANSLYCKIEPLNRMYAVHPECGENYSAQVSLRYDPGELSGIMKAARGLSSVSIAESDLKLFRGPYFADTVQAKWNMVSLPLDPDSANKEKHFPTSISDAFAYQGTYIERTELNFGEGYWMKFPDAQEVIIGGDDIDNFEISVNTGWNMIGSISYPITSASVNSIPVGIVVSEFFGYTTSYEITDTLKPMHAYWVKTNASGKLILSYSAGSSFSKGLSSRNSLDGMNSLTITDTKLNEGKLYFGSGENVDENRHVLPPVPPEGMYDVRFATGNMVAVTEDVKYNDIPIQINSAEYPVTIRWEVSEAVKSASLIVDGREIRMVGTGSAVIVNENSTINLRLSADTQIEIPKEFVLHQNYPNPFNPTTVISYSLPVDCRVTLKIYNLLGQEVKTLVNEYQDAGNKSVEWNANSLPSGVYMYRLNADNPSTSSGQRFTDVKKLILMK